MFVGFPTSTRGQSREMPKKKKLGNYDLKPSMSGSHSAKFPHSNQQVVGTEEEARAGWGAAGEGRGNLEAIALFPPPPD